MNYVDRLKEDESLPFEASGIAAGGVGIAAAPDMLLGRKTLYHGTSAGNARSIEQEGFKPSTGLGGASAHHNSQLFMDESKGKTHFTSIKPIATGFARFMGENDLQDAQSDLDIATKKFHMARKNPETKSQELESIMKEIQQAEFHLQSMTDDHKGKVLKMNVPYHMYDEMKVDPYLLEDIPPEQLGGRLFGATYTEPVDPKYIKNGANGMTFAQRMAQSAEHFPHYIKNHPGRFASGVGVTGYAGKRIYDQLVADENA